MIEPKSAGEKRLIYVSLACYTSETGMSVPAEFPRIPRLLIGL
jgi:hypothetical protein